ncbi:ImmA/IrrE family metallo-endopeptidase [Mycobacteroides abscessus]|uniref:ImmA/IrrE family metallo-endopeptidase n=1 Tax=Mycobacteroides abscessus TaxID=36809 RepID=UPI0012FFDFE3
MISKLFINLNILHPEDLDEENICHQLDIFLLAKPSSAYSYQSDLFNSITIDTRMSQKAQRECFYHELCHILIHVGNQKNTPSLFRELQERDARVFTKYAAIPYHMIRFIDWEHPYLVEHVSDLFKITKLLTESRLLNIRSKIALQNEVPYESSIIY